MDWIKPPQDTVQQWTFLHMDQFHETKNIYFDQVRNYQTVRTDCVP